MKVLYVCDEGDDSKIFDFFAFSDSIQMSWKLKLNGR